MTSVRHPGESGSGAGQPAGYAVGEPVLAVDHAGAAGAHPGYQRYADYQGYPGYQPPVYETRPPGRMTRLILRLWERSPRWLAPAAILACFGGAAAYVLVTDPTDGRADAVPTCIVKLTTGFDCPGCGGTRSFYYLLQGNLPAAARHHALFVFALPFLIYLYVAWAGKHVFGRTLPPLRLPPATIGVFLAAWGVFTVVRNLPWAPFTWLYV